MSPRRSPDGLTQIKMEGFNWWWPGARVQDWLPGVEPERGMQSADVRRWLANNTWRVQQIVLHEHHGDWGEFYDRLDEFYPIRQWPRYYRQLVYGRHMNNPERFALFMFLVWNGLRPELTLFFYIAGGPWDADVPRQLAWLINNAYSGYLFTMYDAPDVYQIGPPPLMANDNRSLRRRGREMYPR